MAQTIHDRERLKRILDLSDRLGTLRRRVREAGSTLSSRDLTQEIRSIAGSVVSIGLPGSLGRLQKEHRLSPQEVMVLLILLNHRIEPGDSSLTGRDVLSTLYPSTFGILSGASLLAPDAALRSSGAVEVVEDDVDLLEARFGLSDVLFRAIEEDVNPRAASARQAHAYRSHYEHLADLARLTSLLLRRAIGRFDADPWGNRMVEEQESPGHLDRRSRILARRIRERLDKTPDGREFPIVALATRLHLTEDEQLILVVLLVQECFYGNPGLEAVECLKMVSQTPEQLLRKRMLLAPRGNLRQHNLVELADPVDEKEITAELVLPNWLSSFLLGEPPGSIRGPIGADVRIAFHEYLKALEDSDRFFRDLDA